MFSVIVYSPNAYNKCITIYVSIAALFLYCGDKGDSRPEEILPRLRRS